MPRMRLLDIEPDDRELTAYWKRVPSEQRRAQPLGTLFARTRALPHHVVAALEVAEASGDYHGTMRKLADLHDDPI